MRYEDVEIVALLLRLKKEKENDVFSTVELAPMLSLSQQSVSRKLRDAERKGLISRELHKDGQRILVLDKGISLVKSALCELAEATQGSKKSLKFKGAVVSGSGEGAYYLSLEKYFLQIKDKLGFVPFRGTLNIEVRDDFNLSAKEEFVSRVPVIIEGFSDSGRSFGELLCFKCRINGKADGAVLIPKRTHHDERIVEVVAAVKLRESLDLKDGDEVEVAAY